MASRDDKPQSSADLHTTSTAEDDPPSLISELQSALGPLLLARKDKYARSQGTGAFQLLSFPRELRDRIYFHYLHRPKGLVYRRRSSSYWSFDPDEHITSLFLTSRQVYDEALHVFTRYNELRFEEERRYYRKQPFKGIEGKLRLLPDKQVSLLQRVRRNYRGYGTGAMWSQMVREANMFEFRCPKMREFTAYWYMLPFSNHATVANLENPAFFANMTEKDKVQTWLELLRRWAKESNLVPPARLKIRFWDEWQHHEQAINAAYARLVKEIGTKNVECEMEEAGKRWLEESWSDAERKGRRRGS